MNDIAFPAPSTTAADIAKDQVAGTFMVTETDDLVKHTFEDQQRFLYIRRIDVFCLGHFQAGKFKEFVEPYSRSDMSEESREANQALVDWLQVWTGEGTPIS